MEQEKTQEQSAFETIKKALELAQKKGTFTMQDSALIFTSVVTLEKYFNEQQTETGEKSNSPKKSSKK